MTGNRLLRTTPLDALGLGGRIRSRSVPAARSGRSFGPRAPLVVMMMLGLAVATHVADAAVEIDVQSSRSTIPVGESASLLVTVRGATGGVSAPDLDVPDNLDVVAKGRSQSFSWVNGRSSSEVTFRYEMVPRSAGNYSVGPIRVKVGNDVFAHPPLTLRAEAAGASLPRGGGAEGAPDDATAGPAPASLIVEVVPREPYVGEPVVLRVRLVQRSPLAEDPRYSPPPTPGFWAERPSEPESFYGTQSNARVLVTETRTRLYPLVAGVQTIGSAGAMLVVESAGRAFDPFGWFRGGARRQFEIKSQPVQVKVRPLPSGSPQDFGGAVGTYTLQWSADQPRTSQDQPVSVRLDVRGSGNLPLLRSPEFRPEGFEVFASTVEDSFAAGGTVESGRRAFRWTVLARSLGALVLDPPRFTWFDPAAHAYRVSQLAPLTIEVGPPTSSPAGHTSQFPEAFTRAPLDPFARSAQPWWLVLAGVLLGLGVVLVRVSRRPANWAAERAERDHLLAVVRGATPEALWGEAERASVWLAARGVDVTALRAEIIAARYGDTRVNPESVRVRLLEVLRHARPDGRAAWVLPACAACAVAVAAISVWFGVPHGGANQGRTRATAAERAARAGNVAGAERVWRSLWKDGARAPGLAARLAWSRLEIEDVAPAALWVLRGEREDSRDPALEWVKARVREAGGLAGGGMRALPVTRLEWGVLAALLGLVAGFAWPRRRASAVCLAALAACTVAVPVQSMVVRQRAEAVVMRDARLGGTDIDLEPGRVVRVRGGDRTRLSVWVGSGVTGWLPADALRVVDSLP